MASKSKNICVRCEALERKQRAKEVYDFQGVKICSVCIEEIHDEMFLIKDITEDDAASGEDFD